MDKHLNIFYAYRHGGYRDTERERILEDNVTRALMIVLKSSCVLTREFLMKFAGIDTCGPYEYDLQSKLESTDSRVKDSRCIPGKRLIVIARKAECPESLQISDEILNGFESCLKDDAGRLQKSLSKLCDVIREKSPERKEIESKLKETLGVGNKNVEGFDLGNPDLPSYFYELTFGSRPDASITSVKTNVLFENKLHGGVTDVQVQRHLRENFGEGFQPKYLVRPASVGNGKPNQIPVLLWTWTDVYEFFSRALDNTNLAGNPVSRFLTRQMLDYLAENNLGPVHLTQDDFAAWASGGNDRIEEELHERIKDLGEALAKALGKHKMVSQKRIQDYIGINILADEFAHESVEQVPHWSLALTSPKGLTLYIQCESKPLVGKLIKERSQLEGTITDALWRMDSRVGLTLSVTHKIFILPGGKGKNAPIYRSYKTFDLGKCGDKEELGKAVSQVFDALECLHSREMMKATLENEGRGRSAWGTLGFNFIWDASTLEKEGTAIMDRVIETAKKMRPYYDAIMDAYR